MDFVGFCVVSMEFPRMICELNIRMSGVVRGGFIKVALLLVGTTDRRCWFVPSVVKTASVLISNLGGCVADTESLIVDTHSTNLIQTYHWTFWQSKRVSI